MTVYGTEKQAYRRVRDSVRRRVLCPPGPDSTRCDDSMHSDSDGDPGGWRRIYVCTVSTYGVCVCVLGSV